jgi:hypothetical protein
LEAFASSYLPSSVNLGARQARKPRKRLSRGAEFSFYMFRSQQ